MILASLISTALVIIFCLNAINRTGEKPNGNILLGVTLPHHALNESAVAEIVKKYRTAHLLLALIFLILAMPILLISEYIFISLFYLWIWADVFIYLNQKIVQKYFIKLCTLKNEQKWWIGTNHIVSIDTEVSRLKNTFLVSNKWFIAPFTITIITMA